MLGSHVTHSQVLHLWHNPRLSIDCPYRFFYSAQVEYPQRTASWVTLTFFWIILAFCTKLIVLHMWSTHKRPPPWLFSLPHKLSLVLLVPRVVHWRPIYLRFSLSTSQRPSAASSHFALPNLAWSYCLHLALRLAHLVLVIYIPSSAHSFTVWPYACTYLVLIVHTCYLAYGPDSCLISCWIHCHTYHFAMAVALRFPTWSDLLPASFLSASGFEFDPLSLPQIYSPRFECMYSPLLACRIALHLIPGLPGLNSFLLTWLNFSRIKCNPFWSN